ncbi:hypothetical protein R1flu_001589 [Riccia fluitans]|uniref:Factor of DNA methylation 1-5/IDN2 domain-containing protein n=1 Tax=Riccia fluitans TaxID=41844 RepID=A0ABD1Y4Q1_9MARC
MENDAKDETMRALTRKERAANDELQAAKRAAEQAIKDHGSPSTLHIRRLGEIDVGPWKQACEKRYSKHSDGWEVCFSEIYSRWAGIIRDPGFSRFKDISVGEHRERYVDPFNTKLCELRAELGNNVSSTVIQALEELEDYNSSGRFPVPMVWNSKEARIASLEESISYLNQRLKESTRTGTQKKKTMPRHRGNDRRLVYGAETEAFSQI